MTIYKVKDIITGLYYTPSRHVKASNGKYVKSNLSKSGKIYTQDPRKHIKNFYDHTTIDERGLPTLRKDVNNLELEETNLAFTIPTTQ